VFSATVTPVVRCERVAIIKPAFDHFFNLTAYPPFIDQWEVSPIIQQKRSVFQVVIVHAFGLSIFTHWPGFPFVGQGENRVVISAIFIVLSVLENSM
jgi:hypothetical protein